jgi:demethoxyubiquinone hydroxylase (CLK1/Coq7/Cat5 family)
MQTIDHTIEVLDSLLRGELSAVETYSHTIHRFPGSPAHAKLLKMRTDHLESVEILRELISELGGNPSTSSGAWGGFAKAVESAAALFGDSSAMAALKQGEDHGIGEYEDALADKALDPEVKDLIREQLLPPLSAHILALEALTA